MLKLLLQITVVALLSIRITIPYAATNDDFGRLFSKPAERDRLNKLRQSQPLRVVPTKENEPTATDAEALSVDNFAPITMHGYVKRSDGVRGTLWINNQAVQEGGVVDDVQVGHINRRGFSSKTANAEGVDVQAGGKKIRLRAGQVYEPETRQIKELQVVEKAKRLRLEEAGVIDGDE